MASFLDAHGDGDGQAKVKIKQMHCTSLSVKLVLCFGVLPFSKRRS
jgi:hypothetical protein